MVSPSLGLVRATPNPAHRERPESSFVSRPGIKTHSRLWKLFTALAVLASLVIYFAPAAADDIAPAESTTKSDAIHISAEHSQDWHDGDTFTSVLRGRCHITQGGTDIAANEMVLWITKQADSGRDHVTAFLDGDVRVEQPGRTLTERSLLLDLVTGGGMTIHVRQRIEEKPATDDVLYRRAWQRRTRGTLPRIRQTQFRAPGPADESPPDGPSLQPFPETSDIPLNPPTNGIRRFQIFSRSQVPFNAVTQQSTDTVPPETVTIITGGVNVQVEGVRAPDGTLAGPIDLSADRVVMWRQGDGAFSAVGEESPDQPLRFYLEGNVVVRQGETVIKSKRGYYDARANQAYIMEAELRSKVPNIKNDVRVRANVIRQLAEQSFHAQGAWITTSEFGKPGYRIEASDIFLDPRPASWFFGGGEPEYNPETGLMEPEMQLWATTLNNTFRFDDLPLFYWPKLSFPAEEPDIPLRRLTYQSDNIFGSQIYTAWDVFMLAGWEEPENMRLNLLLNYFTERGFSIGTDSAYKGEDLFNIAGTYSGNSDSFYIHDSGHDNLGRRRRDLDLETKDRGRLRMRHRHNFPYDITFWGEVGYLTDYNFLEQYFEDEYDNGKDNETYGYAKQHLDNWAWSVIARGRVNDFFTQTEWLPRADLYTLSQPLFGGALTWTQHSWLANANLRTVQDPGPEIDPLFSPLPWDVDVGGNIASTKHELNAPFNLGPAIIVPYALGEVTYWEEDANAEQTTRLYGSLGVRGSLMFSKYMPEVQSDIFNLNGLAHKMLFTADYSYSESNVDLNDVPIYNEFNDNSQEEFTRHMITTTYGGMLPATVDPRFYAVRTGAGRSVTAPYHELVDDQQVARLAWRNRWQTKVGPLDRPRIKDWMILDFETSYFPDPNRDNFGEDFGLFGARYQWNVGARTSLYAGAGWDTFEGGQQLWDAGVLSKRTDRGSFFAGISQIKNSSGLDSQIVTLRVNYEMSPKWRSTVGTAYDIGENQDRGQSVTVTRQGKDFNLRVGASYNPSKNTSSIGISVEPRFINLRSNTFSGDSFSGSGGTR